MGKFVYLSIRIKEDTTMKKDLNIVMNGETLVLDQESMVEVRESNPLTSDKPMFCSSVWQ